MEPKFDEDKGTFILWVVALFLLFLLGSGFVEVLKHFGIIGVQ